MKKIGKQIAAFALVICVLFSLVPTSAAAAASEWTYNLMDVYQANANLSNLQELIAANYERNGWCVQDYNIAGTAQMKSDGLRLYTNETEWIAFKIKTPGTGVYTVKLDYTSSILSGVVAAYILPADTADIDAAISYENRVGMARLTNMESTANLAGTVTFGAWDFGSAPEEEYILVLEAYQRSVYHDSNCQMRLKKLVMTPGDHTQGTQQQNGPAAVTVDSSPIKILSAAPYYGTTAQVNGNNYLFLPIKGNTILTFDLDHNLLVDRIKVPHSITRGITVEDGILWCVGESRYLFRYDPVTRVGEKVLDMGDVVAGASSSLYMHYADGCLYFGIFPASVIGCYEIATGNFKSYGPFHDDCHTVSAITTQGDYIYAGITGDVDGENGFTSQIVKVNAKTGQVEGRLDLSSGADVQVKLNAEHRQFNGVALAGNLLLMGSNTSQKFIIAADVRTMEFVDLNTKLGVQAGVEFDFTEEVEIDGKTYIYFNLTGKGIYALDVTGVTDSTILTDNVNIQLAHKDLAGWSPKPLRCSKHSVIELDDPEFPGKSIVTYYTSDGTPRIYNLQTGNMRTCFDLIEAEDGSGIQARPLVSDPSGSGDLYIGAFNTPQCAIYNTVSGELTNFQANSAQTDAFAFLDGVTYTGNYNNASITRINPDGENEQLLEMKSGYNQARVHAMTAGGGKVFAGTTPYTGYGGCFAWVDVENGDRTVVKENFIENQSINSLTYYNGLVVGTTYTNGGSGSGSLENVSAVLFVYDVAADRKYEFDLRKAPYASALRIDADTTISYIAGVAADPNSPGRFWAMVSQTLFSFTFENGALKIGQVLSFGENEYSASGGRGSFPRPFCFDGKGNLYVSFDDDGGTRRIDTENVADNERLPLPVLTYYALGTDGNLYYTWGTTLMMYPLHITQSDTQAAAAVDAKILSIGYAVTLETETQITDARAAYEALSLTEKSMVHNLYMLQEQEALLLDRKIDTIPETVTREDMQLLDSLWETYTAMTDRQKSIVKNYGVLVAAINEMNANLGIASFQTGDRTYYKIEDAIVAALSGDKTIKLVENAAVEELLLTDGIILDLNGKTLTAAAFRANLPGMAGGYVVDSSLGNEGLLQIARGEDLFGADNPDLPIYDAQSGGYRLFDYKMESHSTTTNIEKGKEKFWFKFHIYTDDTCQQQDMDAYQLIEADGSNLTISVDVMWRDNLSKKVYFGLPDGEGSNSTDLFSQAWATDATLSRWLYLTIGGIHKLGYGKLDVTPTVVVNGVEVKGDVISYANKEFNTNTGWDNNGPSIKN